MLSKSLLLSFCTTALLASVASAKNGSAEIDWDAHQWQAPGPNDLRGPCPGLNTLANHGFLPRDGRNLNMSVIVDAGFDGYHMQPDVLALAVKVAFLTTDDPFSFTLDDIKLHETIEHDASLSREDFALGDNLHFNETIFSTLANSNPGSDFYNTTSAGEVQRLRLADSEARNPNVTNTDKEFFIRSAESGFYLSVMGDPLAGVAPKEFVQIFFREERLPIAEGWHRSETPINSTTLGPLIGKIEAASNWTTSGGCPIIVLGPDFGSF
ncbi:Cloroperoxidase [Dendrothele bispora CBS 962.96]|uniref:Cloroperoxidase n=1 Tax=Dendrothele bispora (strain CBS 962.96) TaxID=1314807 RepID=A0A4V6T596_DENBC|nr:Cloroperoxidase [Dendrothele bispora CBS 962.96]